jgi:hypothetical protein
VPGRGNNVPGVAHDLPGVRYGVPAVADNLPAEDHELPAFRHELSDRHNSVSRVPDTMPDRGYALSSDEHEVPTVPITDADPEPRGMGIRR